MVSVNRTIQEYEEQLVRRIEDLSYIVNGLDTHEPYLKALEHFKSTRDVIDQNWHLIMDLNKLNEVRMSKMAANSIINFITDMKFDLDKLQKELIILRNPDSVVNKDYDPN